MPKGANIPKKIRILRLDVWAVDDILPRCQKLLGFKNSNQVFF